MKFTTIVLALSFSGVAAFSPAALSSRPSTMLQMSGVLSSKTGQSSLDPSVIDRYNDLAYPSEKLMAEYVWVDAVGNTRSKTRTLLASKVESVDSLPKWNFDGSSTDQAPGDDSEVILYPRRIFKDPFRPRSDDVDNILVMCDTYTPAGEALETNTRAKGMFHRSEFVC